MEINVGGVAYLKKMASLWLCIIYARERKVAQIGTVTLLHYVVPVTAK
jgi:hypothetical protein